MADALEIWQEILESPSLASDMRGFLLVKVGVCYAQLSQHAGKIVSQTQVMDEIQDMTVSDMAGTDMRGTMKRRDPKTNLVLIDPQLHLGDHIKAIAAFNAAIVEMQKSNREYPIAVIRSNLSRCLIAHRAQGGPSVGL